MEITIHIYTISSNKFDIEIWHVVVGDLQNATFFRYNNIPLKSHSSIVSTFEVLLWKKFNETSNILSVFGEEVGSERTLQYCFKRFKSRNTNLDNEEHDRPSS